MVLRSAGALPVCSSDLKLLVPYFEADSKLKYSGAFAAFIWYIETLNCTVSVTYPS